MYSKNNKRLQELKMADGRQRFSLRRLNVGTVSVLIGTIFFFGAAGTASADTVPTDTSVNVTTSTDQTSSTDSQSVVLSKTASASDASTVVNSASASAASDSSSLASSASTASTSVNTTDLLSSATVTNSTAVSASDGTQSAASPQKVNALAALDTNLTVNIPANIPANVARNYKGVAWANYDELNYDDIKYADKSYYDNKPITNGVLNVSSTDPLPDNWTTTLKQPSAGVPVPKFSDSSSKTYYTFASVKDINNNTEVGSYVATKNLTDDQLVVTYFEKTGDTYAQKNSVQLTQGQTTTLGSVSIEYPSGSEIIMTPNDGSTLQLAYHYMNTASTSPAQKVTFSVPTYAEQTIEFIDITTGENVFTPIKRQILVGSQYKTVPFQDISYDIIAPSNDSGTATNSLNPNTINIVYYYKRIITLISKPTSQYILYQGAGNQTPPSITNNYDLAGELNNDTGSIYWYEDGHTYDAVNTPVVTGYYADKAVVPERTATIDNPEVDDTVTYKPLGKIIPVDQNGKEIANTSKTYENDPDDPTKATTTKTPDIKGYEKLLQEVTPDNPGEDTKVTYTPIINQVEVPTSQTVKYEGAGDLTPKDNEQKDFTFYKMISEATGEVLFWNVTDHTYDSVNTPVVEGYYADTAVVPGQTVTHDQPNVEVTVTYKPLGKIIPVDSDGNPIPGAETPTYENDPDDPTKTTTTKTPDIKGYKKSLQEVTPDNPGKDTKVTYTPIINEVTVPTSQTVKYEGAGDQTPKDNVQNDYTFTGKSNEATGKTTWDEETHAYKPVKTPVVEGYYTDIASVDNIVLTPEHPTEEVTVKYRALGRIVPVDPEGNVIPNAPMPTYSNDPSDPTKTTTTKTPDIKGYTKSEKEVTPTDPGSDTEVVYTPIIKDATVPTSQTVKYEGAGDLTPKDNIQDGYKFTGKSNEATGKTTWDEEEHSYDSVDTPVVNGYYANAERIAGQTVTPDHPNAEVTVTYKPLGKIIPVDSDGNPIPGVSTPTYNNDKKDPTKIVATDTPDIPGYQKSETSVTPDDPGSDTEVVYTQIITQEEVPTSQTVKYEGAGVQTPGPNVQKDFTFYKMTNEATGVVFWNVTNYTYESVDTPVVNGYYANVASVEGKTVTHEQPNAEVTVTYKPLGKIIPVDENHKPISGASTPTYNNDEKDPTKAVTTDTPDIPGYQKTETSVTPTDPGSDTEVVYTPIIKDATVPTSQTVKYEGAGDLTPKDNVQNDYTFTGKSNEATGKTTWDEETHAYKPVKTPVIPGYYADVASVDNIVL
ncbi:mucin-binding protein, partial [Limosilactobacillus mucosae]